MRHLAVVLILGACGNSAGPGTGPIGDASCALAASFTGTASWETTGAPACGIPFGSSSGVNMVFLPFNDPGVTEAIEIDVADIMAGQTGAFPAEVTVRIAELGTFAAATCSVEISEHVYVAEADLGYEEFRLAGEGSCDVPATHFDGGSLELAPFEFRFSPRWPKP